METHAAGSGPRHTLGGGIGFLVFSVMAVLVAARLLTACTPLPRAIALPSPTASAPLPADSPEPCDLPEVDDQLLKAAWAYVHERYPAQPWPDTVYLPGDWTVHIAARRHLTHVVLCSHATGFVWEGEVAWRLHCACCSVEVEGVREAFVASAAPAATSATQP